MKIVSTNQAADTEITSTLKTLLERARRGDFSSIAVVTITDEGVFETSFHFMSDAQQVVAIAGLQRELLGHIMGDE